MLAKEIKIANLKKQKEFIYNEFFNASKREKDGCALYVFKGFIYPEVTKALEEEGLELISMHPDFNGVPTTLIYAKDVELTEEELKQAEEYDYFQDIVEEDEDEEKDEERNEIPSDFISQLLGGIRLGSDDEDDPYKYEGCDEYDPLEDDSQA